MGRTSSIGTGTSFVWVSWLQDVPVGRAVELYLELSDIFPYWDSFPIKWCFVL
jgi:hypothetical protein